MPRNKNQGNSTTPKPYASRGTNVSKGGVLSNETASHIEEMVGKETKRKKKKEQKKTEDGIVKRLAKNGLIDTYKARRQPHQDETLEEDETEEERLVRLFLL